MNTVLHHASDLIQKETGLDDSDVTIEWIGERGVKVSNVFAFKQPRGSDMGAFCGQYTYVKLA